MGRVRGMLMGVAGAAALLLALPLLLAATQGGTVQAPRFEVDPFWPRPLPDHWLLGSATGIAIDERDHVFVVHLTDSFTARTETGAGTITPDGECCSPAPNVLEFDPDGNLVRSWGGPGPGHDWPAQNAGITIDPAGNLWIGGMGGTDTRVLKFTREGQFIAQFGAAFEAPAAARGGRGADTAYAGVSPGRQAGAGRGGRGGRGAAPSAPPASTSMERFGGAMGFAFDRGANEAFVADGSRNRRVAVVDVNTGRIKRFFGAYGGTPDDTPQPEYAPEAPPARQFATVRCVERAADGTLYVCDARNNRIQVFRGDGTFLKEVRVEPATLARGSVWDIAFSRDAQQRYLYVADGSNMKVHVLDRQALQVLTSFGDGGRYPGQFLAVAGVATDSKGNLYTVEADQGKRVQRFAYRGVGPVSRTQGVPRPPR